MIKNKLHYVYYRFYRLQVSVGNDGIAVFSSIAMMSFILMLNLFFIIGAIYAFTGAKILSGNPVAIGLGIYGSILTILYILFIYNGRYKAIIKENMGESTEKVKKGNIAVCLYLLISILLLAVGFYLMIQKNLRFL